MATRSEALKKAQLKYEKKLIRKQTILNTEKDGDVIEYINKNIPNFTDWVKKAIRREIQEMGK